MLSYDKYINKKEPKDAEKRKNVKNKRKNIFQRNRRIIVPKKKDKRKIQNST